MENRKVLIICSSPYTVFNAINYASSTDDDVDIVMFDKTRKIREIYEKLQNEHIFKNVHLFKDFQSSKYFKFITFFAYCFPRLYMHWICDKPIANDYNIVLLQNVFYGTLFSRVIKDAHYYLIEDGLGSYVHRVSVISKRNKYLKILNRFLFSNRLIPNIEGQFVYRPELLNNDSSRVFGYKLENHIQMTAEMMKRIYSYRTNALLQQRKIIIFGDSEMKTNYYIEEGKEENKYEFLEKHIFPILPNELTLYRPHPAEIIADHYLTVIIDDVQNNWELDSMFAIHDDYMLINFYSTAVVTSKLMYNKEPYILFLYNFIEYYKDKHDPFTEFINKVRAMYTNPEKVCIAYSFEDIQCFLDQYFNRENLK